MSSDEIRERTQKSLGQVLHLGAIWERSACTPTLRARLGFIFLSKLYRQMYAGTGISTDSARRKKSKRWARWTAHQCKKLFRATPMPELAGPVWPEKLLPSIGQRPSPALKAFNLRPFVVMPDN